MAHPERMAILIQLLDSERNIAELAKSLSLPATAVSGHLNRLRAGGRWTLRVTTALSNTA